jgi:hypothetical protein
MQIMSQPISARKGIFCTEAVPVLTSAVENDDFDHLFISVYFKKRTQTKGYIPIYIKALNSTMVQTNY